MGEVTTKRRPWGWGLPVLGGAAICLACVCHQPNPTPTPVPPVPTEPEHVQVQSLPHPLPTPAANRSRRWLYAERFVAGTTDGFVEGDFSAKRNRLIIKTNEVTRFAVDTRHVGIDWDKLVVIQINGHNSELRRRDDPVLHFVLDKNKQWIVEE